MPLSCIVVIGFRMFVLYWLIRSVEMALAVTAAHAKSIQAPQDYWDYTAPVGLIILAALIWRFAPAISRLLARGYESTVAVPAVPRLDLYSFAFVLLGLYFALWSVAPAINWVHYVLNTTAAGSRQAENSLYDLAGSLLTLTAGLIMLLFARHWARRLVAAEERREQA